MAVGRSEAAYLGVARKAEFTYTATDDTLNLELINNIQEAKVNAIQITQLGGTFVPPADTTAPVIIDIFVENPPSDQDSDRDAVITLQDETGFDQADFIGLTGAELTFTGIVPGSVSAPVVRDIGRWQNGNPHLYAGAARQ